MSKQAIYCNSRLAQGVKIEGGARPNEDIGEVLDQFGRCGSVGDSLGFSPGGGNTTLNVQPATLDTKGVLVGAGGVLVGAKGVLVGAKGVPVRAGGVLVGTRGVVVGAGGVVVGA